MLTHGELAALERSLRGDQVLSVYVEGSAPDFAVQQRWRVALDNALDAEWERIEHAPAEERERFSMCVIRLNESLDWGAPRAGSPGWVAFITADGVRYASPVPATMPTLVSWQTGAMVTPYLRALKQSRPAIVALMDARRARVYRYRFGVLEELATLRAHHVVQPPSHMGDAPAQGFHPGARGTTGRDAAQRSQLAGMKRMLGELAEQVTALAGEDGWILLGGISRVVAHAEPLFAPLERRMRVLPGLDVHSTAAEITGAAREGASSLRDAEDALEVDEVARQAEAGALGTLGATATERALELACVRTLLVSARYLTEHATEAEKAVRRAFEQDAVIEEISRSASRRLDESGGIAARLRFRPPAERFISA